MQQLLIYILKWAIGLTIMYIPFTLLMRKETFHALTRIILLCTIVASALLSIVTIKIPIEIELPHNEDLNIIAQSTLLTTTTNVQSATQLKDYDAWAILAAIYLTGVAISLALTIINILKIKKAIKVGTLWQEHKENYTLHCHANNIPSFSWFNNIVISENDYKECANEIITHEEGHIMHKHSYDILIVDIIKAAQWFNPIIYMLINDLKDIHEYEADKFALKKNSDAQAYQLLILKKSIGKERLSIANNFGRKSVRKRIEMMINKKNQRHTIYKASYIIPTAAITILAFAKPEYIYSYNPNNTPAPTTTIVNNEHKEQSKPQSTTPAEDTTPIKPSSTKSCKKEKTNTNKAATPQAAEVQKDTMATEQPKEEIIKDKASTVEHLSAEITLDKDIFDGKIKAENNYKCSMIFEFDIDKNGNIVNTVAKACNVRIYNNTLQHLAEFMPQIKENAILTAAEYLSKITSDNIYYNNYTISNDTHYIANVTMRNGKQNTITIGREQKEALWIGTTPIK